MAAAVVEAGADRQVDVERAAVGDAAGRIAEAAGVQASGPSIDRHRAVAVVVLVEAVLGVEAEPSKSVSMMKLTTPATASAP